MYPGAMQALRLLFVVTAVSFTCIVEGAQVCGLRSAKGRAFIRNGQDTINTTEIPWNVILYDMKAKTGPTQICSGSLIKTDYFVSAAHCFYLSGKFLRNVSDFSAVVGGLYRAWDAAEDTKQHVQLKQIFLHSFMGPSMLYLNDIALVLLSTHVSINVNVLPICLDWGQRLPPLQSGTHGLVAGFGGDRSMQYNVLQYTTLPYLDDRDCKANMSVDLHMYTAVPDKFCVGVTNGSAVGPGDSGGGIAFETEGKWFLRGVVSLGSAKKVENSFFTNVAQHVSWISDIAKEVVVPNLDAKCLRCICEASSGCNTTYGCADGFCGPFYMSRVYWRDGGKPVLPEDDPIRNGAYEDCGRNYTCSAATVTNYMSKYVQDCNGDGLTDCDDYAMIHFNGGNACYQPIGATNFSARYELCRADTLSLPPRTANSFNTTRVLVSVWGATRHSHYRGSNVAAASF